MKAIVNLDPKINNNISGTILFYQLTTNHSVCIQFDLKGFIPYSTHAIHIHEFGDLSQGCISLGGHFNPTKKVHSHYELGHAGDLFNNFQADSKGEFKFNFKTNKLSLFQNSKCILGRSVVIHKFIDDYGLGGIFDSNGVFVAYRDMDLESLQKITKTLGYPLGTRKSMIQKLESESITTGNASTRIACGIIGLAKS
jgi:Cu-Zn family superoxide dismutase